MSVAPPLPTSGTLDRRDAADVLRELAAHRATGTLRIGNASPVWVLLVDGQVALAGRRGGTSLRTAAAQSTLDPSLLATLGEATNDPACATALVERFGAAALPVIRAHVVATVFGVLLPSSEPFVFAEMSPPPIPDVLRFGVDDVLAEASDRVERWRRVAESIPSVDTVFRPRRRLAPEIASVHLTPDEWTVLVVLDGRRSVAQTIAAVGRSAFDVCSVLHELLARGLIERVT